MKSLCGLSLWMKDCRAETGFQRDRRRGREGGRKTQKVKYNNWVTQSVCGDYKKMKGTKKHIVSLLSVFFRIYSNLSFKASYCSMSVGDKKQTE